MDHGPRTLAEYIGKSITELPTPCLVLSHVVLKRNTARLLQDIQNIGIGFRAHVKTLKSVEVTRMMLGSDHKKVVVSTLREIRGLRPLIDDGSINEILYGLPIYPGALPQLHALASNVTILLMIDNAAHIDLLERFNTANPTTPKWRVFVKIDMGSTRAGVRVDSPRLKSLIQRLEASQAVSIYGFYCHAGHSYGCRDVEAAAGVLRDEVAAAAAAAELMRDRRDVVLSVGATPTAHVISSLRQSLPDRLHLELHAGNYPVNDLQQLATASIHPDDIALRVLAEVCSVYPERNEAIVNAGVLALGRETGPFPGCARVVGAEGWNVGRLSQEHGILVREEEREREAKGKGARDVGEEFWVGKRVALHVQHACITAAGHGFYFVVDERDVVTDVWYPWKGW